LNINLILYFSKLMGGVKMSRKDDEDNKKIDRENEIWDDITNLELETASKKVEMLKKIKEIWNE